MYSTILMGRNAIVYDTLEQKLQASKDYQKAYYKKKSTPKVVHDAISRIATSDENIMLFIRTIGQDKIQELLLKNL